MSPPTSRSALALTLWSVVLIGLLALRLPAIAEPAGNDQSLYMYVADQIRHGGVPYLDAWDQKPPGVAFVYAALRTVWPHESAVAIGDLLAAGIAAAWLVAMGRRTIGGAAGALAAAIFLLFGHPSFSRIGGVYVRGQCEVFIAAAATAAIAIAWRRHHRPLFLIAAGLSLGAAFWLKYNALAYAAPAAIALTFGQMHGARRSWREIAVDAGWMAAGALALSAVVLLYFAGHHGLEALWLATIDYNIQYSRETYTAGARGALGYLLSLPLERARADMLWFLGLTGAALLVVTGWRRHRPIVLVSAAWLAAAIVSIAVNGARNLPQYFVQAGPALALAGAAGFVLAWRRGLPWRAVAVAIVIAGLWRVGVDAPSLGGLRWGALPQFAANIAFDVDYVRGRIDRPTYLARFKGAQKYDAAAVEDLSTYIAATTTRDDRILVFGFAPGVYLQSDRLSASRFLWSRPVILEFASDRPGYGSAGLLADLRRTRPAVVALQKQDWRPFVADADDLAIGAGAINSQDFFLATAPLRDWLTSSYTLERDTAMFSVWKRTS
jgi:hypothetical protein